MNSDHAKRTGATLRSFEHSMPLIFAWAVVAAFVVVLFRSHWSFTEWLREVFQRYLAPWIVDRTIVAASCQRLPEAERFRRLISLYAMGGYCIPCCPHDAMDYCAILSLTLCLTCCPSNQREAANGVTLMSGSARMSPTIIEVKPHRNSWKIFRSAWR
jgi:hypothetical protein